MTNNGPRTSGSWPSWGSASWRPSASWSVSAPTTTSCSRAWPSARSSIPRALALGFLTASTISCAGQENRIGIEDRTTPIQAFHPNRPAKCLAPEAPPAVEILERGRGLRSATGCGRGRADEGARMPGGVSSGAQCARRSLSLRARRSNFGGSKRSLRFARRLEFRCERSPSWGHASPWRSGRGMPRRLRMGPRRESGPHRVSARKEPRRFLGGASRLRGFARACKVRAPSFLPRHRKISLKARAHAVQHSLTGRDKCAILARRLAGSGSCRCRLFEPPSEEN